MRLLLDTHILLWAAAQSARLPAKARELLEDADNEVYCSSASLWEIAIKATLGRADFQVDLGQLRSAFPAMSIQELPVTGKHAEAVLALSPIHKDPFDRMLVAQSLSEPLTLLSNDAVLGEYGASVMLV